MNAYWVVLGWGLVSVIQHQTNQHFGREPESLVLVLITQTFIAQPIVLPSQLLVAAKNEKSTSNAIGWKLFF